MERITGESLSARDFVMASFITAQDIFEALAVEGVYVVECYDKDGKLKWGDRIDNTVMTLGKNYIFDSALAASVLTTVGPYMGLISSSGYSAISAADVMSSHAGWTESTAYTGNRKTCVFSAASAGAKALSAALSFAISGTETLKGAFIVTGTGALNTKSDTNGTLLSAGLFSGGDKIVANGDTVNVSWSISG